MEKGLLRTGYFMYDSIFRITVNPHYFFIRKSTNETSCYETGMVKSVSNSIIMQAYQFEDADLGEVSQIVYYEEVTVDANEKAIVSEMKFV